MGCPARQTRDPKFRRGRASMLRTSHSALKKRSVVAALALVLGTWQLNQATFAQDASHRVPADSRLTDTVRAIQAAEPAVVNIEGNKVSSKISSGEPQQVNGMGSGVIIDPRGYILTNQHVVQDVTRIEVTLHDRTKYIGTLVGRDSATDLALVKIEPTRELPVIHFGTSSDLLRGERVIAIGNPFGYQHTVTEGIISALHRDIPVNGVQEYKDLIQTDASINPGNSGGPLVNIEGHMIGLNAAVRVGAQGIGFAIPVDKALEVAADMISSYVNPGVKLPIEVAAVTSSGRVEVRLQRVLDDSGELNGLKEGDRVLRIGKRAVNNRLDYELCLLDINPSVPLDVEVEREGIAQTAKVAAVSHTRVNSPSAPAAGLVATRTTDDRLWQSLGLRVKAADARLIKRIDPSYNGGLSITAVRDGSPAAAAQLKPNDILVGLHDWQTPNRDDLTWILNSSELKQNAEPKFRIIRGGEVFGGVFDLKRSGIR